jgi:2-haloacid dehalogenase
MPRVLVFDVNETLLDLGALDPVFEEVFGEASVRREWFGQVLQSAFLTTIIGSYASFGEIGASALQMTARHHRAEVSDEDRQRILGGMRELPPHPEVPEALERLRDAGFRLATLTNNTQEVVDAQLENAGLTDFFEERLTADAVQRLKPAPEPYRMAAERLGVEADGVRLVAAHAWDVTGAIAAGCTAAFVARPGMILDPVGNHPDVVGSDLQEVSEAIIAAETEGSLA